MNSKNSMSLFRVPARVLLALFTAGAATLPALAAPPSQNSNRPAQGAPAAGARSLKVSYYDGDPQKGGKLISTLTLTPPQRAQGPQAQPQQIQTQQAQPPARTTPDTPGTGGPDGHRAGARPNPVVDQAPKGAKFAVVQDGQGRTRTIDLAHPGLGLRGPGDRAQPDGSAPPSR